MYINIYSVFVLSCPWATQLSRDVPADAGFLCINAAVVGVAIEERHFSVPVVEKPPTYSY
jgi:hypothetical protein